MKTNNSYLKHQVNILKNPTGKTPEQMEKAADYILKQLEILNEANANLMTEIDVMKEQISRLIEQNDDLGMQVETLKAKIAKKKAPKKAV